MPKLTAFQKQAVLSCLPPNVHDATLGDWMRALHTLANAREFSRNKAKMVDGIVNEVLEFSEAATSQEQPDNPLKDGEANELVDVIQRLFNYASVHGHNLPEVMLAKLQYNLEREDHDVEGL